MPRLFVLFLVLLTLGCRQEAQSKAEGQGAGFAKGSKVPEYKGSTLDGELFTLPDSKQRVLLVNLWATWCGPCRYEVPELRELQTRYESQQFDVVGISVDTADAAAAVREFVDEYKINYPVVHDPEGTMATLMNTSVLPTSALVDRSGKIVWLKVGIVRTDDAEFTAALKKAL